MSSYHSFKRALVLSLGSGLCCFLLSSALVAQETGAIRGQVKTTDGQAVADAEITLAGSTVQFRVDDEGRFEIGSIAPGTHLISISSTRHAERTVEQVEVVAGQTVFHAHLHVLPRHAGDPFRVDIEALNRGTPTRSALDDQARVLGSMLGPTGVR